MSDDHADVIASTTGRLLQAWERCRDRTPMARALCLLNTVWPELALADWARASIGDRDACLFLLQSSLFGCELQTTTTCPECGERLESGIAIRDLCTLPDALPAPRPDLLLEHNRYRLSYRLPCSEDLMHLPTSDPQREEDALLDRCVSDARHGKQKIAPSKLPPEVRELLGERMAEHDPTADIRLALCCPACNHRWQAAFDIVDYVWRELDEWAQNLLAQVHLLARSYAWSERDILAMSPHRRNFYLELVRA